MTAILGISAFYHDSAAAIVLDGKIIAAAQQERYSRIKHDQGFPKDAIAHCLRTANVTIQDLDAVVFYDKPLLKFERLLESFLGTAPKGFLAFSRAMPIWLKEKLYLKSLIRRELRDLYRQTLLNDMSLAQGGNVATGNPHVLHPLANEALTNEALKKEAKRQAKALSLPPLRFCEHHQSHAAAAYFPSPFTDAAVVCLDGVGEWATSSIWHGQGHDLTPLRELHFPHSLGLLYSAFTYYCGFKVNSGEYKLMGLAPYGRPKYAQLIKQHLIDIKDDGSFVLNMKYFDYASGSRMVNTAFEKLFGGKAHPFDAPMTQKQMDLAMSIQQVTEEVVLKIAKEAKRVSASRNLCLAGGVALNCVANGKILEAGIFDKIWIQPAAGDAGSALGAALQYWYSLGESASSNTQQDMHQNKRIDSNVDSSSAEPSDDMRQALLGDSFTEAQISKVCDEMTLPYEILLDDELFEMSAAALYEDKVVGWFQGAMEFGPRALGNRSILGNPCSPHMQSQMNLKIKQRESFRPFAPAVLREDASHWFDLDDDSPYMLLVAKLKEAHRIVNDASVLSDDKAVQSSPSNTQDIQTQINQTKSSQKTSSYSEKSIEEIVNQQRSTVPAITHVDYSARVQTVEKSTHPRFHALISAFKAKSGVGMLINTSFNVRGEPPVRSPEDAIRCFLATEMDMLVMGNIVLRKAQQAQDAIDKAKQVVFEKD